MNENDTIEKIILSQGKQRKNRDVRKDLIICSLNFYGRCGFLVFVALNKNKLH